MMQMLHLGGGRAEYKDIKYMYWHSFWKGETKLSIITTCIGIPLHGMLLKFVGKSGCKDVINVPIYVVVWLFRGGGSSGRSG